MTEPSGRKTGTGLRPAREPSLCSPIATSAWRLAMRSLTSWISFAVLVGLLSFLADAVAGAEPASGPPRDKQWRAGLQRRVRRPASWMSRSGRVASTARPLSGTAPRDGSRRPRRRGRPGAFRGQGEPRRGRHLSATITASRPRASSSGPTATSRPAPGSRASRAGGARCGSTASRSAPTRSSWARRSTSSRTSTSRRRSSISPTTCISTRSSPIAPDDKRHLGKLDGNRLYRASARHDGAGGRLGRIPRDRRRVDAAGIRLLLRRQGDVPPGLQAGARHHAADARADLGLLPRPEPGRQLSGRLRRRSSGRTSSRSTTCGFTRKISAAAEAQGDTADEQAGARGHGGRRT